MKFWDDGQIIHKTDAMARMSADQILSHFNVVCRVTKVSLGYIVEIPADTDATVKEAITGFLVAYGRGWEDHKMAEYKAYDARFETAKD